MYQGYYNLASQMISQNRNLNVISNNMSNAVTPGYKSDTFLGTTFREEMLYRTGGTDNKTPAAVGTVSRMWASDTTATNFENGAIESTGNVLDFALEGNGFFQIQTPEGTVYTRSGSFTTDNEGYLTLPGIGRVLGNGGAIQLPTDQIEVDAVGQIFSRLDGAYLGQIAVVDFEDYTQLEKDGNGMFVTGAAPQGSNAQIVQGALEGSNVSMIGEMVAMMSSQRAIQSSAQVLKMYDQLMGKASQIGSVS